MYVLREEWLYIILEKIGIRIISGIKRTYIHNNNQKERGSKKYQDDIEANIIKKKVTVCLTFLPLGEEDSAWNY